MALLFVNNQTACQIKLHLQDQMSMLPVSVKLLLDPDRYVVGLEPSLQALKIELIERAKNNLGT